MSLTYSPLAACALPHIRGLATDGSMCKHNAAGVIRMCRIAQYNEAIAVRIHFDIKLVPRVAHNDKEDPLASLLAHSLDSLVPEADGSMWMQFTHEQGRKEKTIFPPLLCSCYSLTKALMDNAVWYIGIWEYRLHLCLPEVRNNTIHRMIVWILPLILVSYSSPKFDMETLKNCLLCETVSRWTWPL